MMYGMMLLKILHFMYIFQNNFSKSCCPKTEVNEVSFTFWQSQPYENGTQLLKPQAIWSDSYGLMRMMPIDLEIVTLRVAILPVSLEKFFFK